MKMKAIITGVTGMVGEGVLHECLQHPDVEQVLIINRKPSGITHPKLKEIVHADFFDLATIEGELNGYDTCLFCLGVTSIGLSEEKYSRVTYDLTLNFAKTLCRLNPQMVFCYISGAGTDGSETKRNMWIRVKGKTENALLRLPFKKAYMFRPGYIKPGKGMKNTHSFYYLIDWMYPFWKLVTPQFFCTIQELGTAMINCTLKGYDKPVLEVKDIVKLAKA
jgi:uncharacterized protein YbjT (DUF2867 family)